MYFPDQSNEIDDPSIVGNYLMCVEVITITTEDSTHAEIQLATQHGKFVYLDIVNEPELFKVVIPKSAHRVQCVQHCVALSCNLTVYVVADTGICGILRCVDCGS